MRRIEHFGVQPTRIGDAFGAHQLVPSLGDGGVLAMYGAQSQSVAVRVAGHVRAEVDVTGVETHVARREPFGTLTSGGPGAIPFGYKNYYEHVDSDLMRPLWRSYDASLKTFTSTDPLSGNLAWPESVNRWRAFSADAVNVTDVLGLTDIGIVGCVGCGGSGGGGGGSGSGEGESIDPGTTWDKIVDGTRQVSCWFGFNNDACPAPRVGEYGGVIQGHIFGYRALPTNSVSAPTVVRSFATLVSDSPSVDAWAQTPGAFSSADAPRWAGPGIVVPGVDPGVFSGGYDGAPPRDFVDAPWQTGSGSFDFTTGFAVGLVANGSDANAYNLAGRTAGYVIMAWLAHQALERPVAADGPTTPRATKYTYVPSAPRVYQTGTRLFPKPPGIYLSDGRDVTALETNVPVPTPEAGGAGAVSGGGPLDPKQGDPLTGKAPYQVTPGTRQLEGQYVNDLGRIEPWTAHYDEYGRIVARTDYNAGNRAASIPDVHYHLFQWGPGKTPLQLDDHFPGEYAP